MASLSKLETTDITRHFFEPSEKQKKARKDAEQQQASLIAKLDEWEEYELAETLRACKEEITLICQGCGTAKRIWAGCKQKWCPVCVRKIAAQRAAKFQKAVEAMEWPLFITLTIPNTADLDIGGLRHLRRSFGKLRHMKLWSQRVRGGVAGIEITNQGHGWHPHLHAVIDCRWLAWKTPRPQPGEGKKAVREKCKAASDELGLAWARCCCIKALDPDWCGVIYKVKRCKKDEIGKEVLKYSVKGTDLIESEQNPADLIRAMQATRLVTSFGTLFGAKPSAEKSDTSRVHAAVAAKARGFPNRL